MTLDISTITGKLQPTFDEKFFLVKSVMKYLKGNLMGRNPEGEWFNRQKGEEGIYAEPKINWELGEVDAWHGGGLFKKFEMSKIGSGEGNRVFGYGGYFSSQAGVGKHYKNLYQRKHGAEVELKVFNTDKFKDLVRNEIKDVLSPDETEIFLGSQPFRKAAENINNVIKKVSSAGLTRKNQSVLLKKQIKDQIKYAVEDVQNIETNLKLGYEQSAKLSVTRANSISRKLVDSLEDKKQVSALYKAKLWEGKNEILLDWYEPISKSNVEKINSQLRKEKLYDIIGPANYQGAKGGEFYRDLAGHLGDKKASELLNRAGIDGIKYPVGTLLGGGKKKGFNYVVFDESAVRVKRQ